MGTGLYDNLKFPKGPRFKSPVGKRFDMLFVLAFEGNRKGHSYWKCVCDCGEMKVMSQKDLHRSPIRSCGCKSVNFLGTGKGSPVKKKKRDLYDTVELPAHRNFKSLLGKRFGKLFVLAFDGKRGESSYWKCVCDCGEMRIASSYRVTSGEVKSCGCGGENRAQRGRECDPEYGAWANMRRRCGDSSNQDYHNYGGKGVRVCERWAVYLNFLEDMGRKPTPKHSIDRKDGNGDYEPDNCRWATATEQARNLSTNLLLEHQGQTKCASEWAESAGMRSATLRTRLKLGWSIKDAIETPVGQKRKSK